MEKIKRQCPKKLSGAYADYVFLLGTSTRYKPEKSDGINRELIVLEKSNDTRGGR